MIFTTLAFLFILTPAFAVLEIPNNQPKIGAAQWKVVLDSTWKGLIRRNIDTYNTGLIHRIKSETPGDAVSEAVGYGLLLALYADDQTTFNRIFNASKTYQLGACQNWRVNQNGAVTGGGSASDADEDIAMALIFADKLVKKGRWNSETDYATPAQSAIDCVWGESGNGNLLNPGNGWGPPYNPGYFAPAWYRIFKNFDSNKGHNWDNLINNSYTLLEKNPGYNKGLVPDWTDANGNSLAQGPGYNAYLNGQAFFKDAIRTLWRIANDYIWFGEPRAKEYLENALDFINSKGGASAANYYQMSGELIPAADKWTAFNNQNNPDTWRWRREHSHLTIGQWATAAMAVGDSATKVDFSSEMAKFYDWDNKVDFFGIANDPDSATLEDTLHNEMYFDQFLAWFGVSLMSGTWVNIVELLDNPVENTAGIEVDPFPEEIPPEPILAGVKQPNVSFEAIQSGETLRLTSKLKNPVWKIHDLRGALLFSSAGGDAAWNIGSFKGVVSVSLGNERKLFAIH